MTDIEVDVLLDACGLNCPLPLLKAKQSLNKLSSGQILKVICTDPGSVRDFDVFAVQSGHRLLNSAQTQVEGQQTYLYWFEKA